MATNSICTFPERVSKKIIIEMSSHSDRVNAPIKREMLPLAHLFPARTLAYRRSRPAPKKRKVIGGSGLSSGGCKPAYRVSIGSQLARGSTVYLAGSRCRPRRSHSVSWPRPMSLNTRKKARIFSGWELWDQARLRTPESGAIEDLGSAGSSVICDRCTEVGSRRFREERRRQHVDLERERAGQRERFHERRWAGRRVLSGGAVGQVGHRQLEDGSRRTADA